MKTNIHFWPYLAQFFLVWKTLQTKVVQEIKKHILYSATIFFFFFENRAIYEIMWKNMVQRGRPQVTIWRMCIAYWKTKATHIHTNCTTYCFSTATMVVRTPSNVTFIRTLSLFFYIGYYGTTNNVCAMIHYNVIIPSKFRYGWILF